MSTIPFTRDYTVYQLGRVFATISYGDVQVQTEAVFRLKQCVRLKTVSHR